MMLGFLAPEGSARTMAESTATATRSPASVDVAMPAGTAMVSDGPSGSNTVRSARFAVGSTRRRPAAVPTSAVALAGSASVSVSGRRPRTSVTLPLASTANRVPVGTERGVADTLPQDPRTACTQVDGHQRSSGIQRVHEPLVEVCAYVSPDGRHAGHRPAEWREVGAAIGHRLAPMGGQAEQGRGTGGVEYQGQCGEGLATRLVAGRRQQGADQEDVADVHAGKDNETGSPAREGNRLESGPEAEGHVVAIIGRPLQGE